MGYSLLQLSTFQGNSQTHEGSIALLNKVDFCLYEGESHQLQSFTLIIVNWL